MAKSPLLSPNQVFRICVFWSRIGPPLNECIEMLSSIAKENMLALVDERLALYCGVLEKDDILTSKKIRYHIKKNGLPKDLDFNNIDFSYLGFDGLQVFELPDKK